MNMIAIILVLISTVIGAFASLYLKKGSKKFNLHLFQQLKNKTLIIGLSLYVLSAIVFIAALKLENVSLIYPITSLGYIWISLLSVKYLKEKMNLWKWVGIAFIILGVILITL